MVAVVGFGLAMGLVFGVDGTEFGDSYAWLPLTLLAVGLYGSTLGIDRHSLDAGVGNVVTAVTVGVVLKAVLIGLAMAAILQDMRYLVLGVVVAQIDPLSVAALEHSARVSTRAKSILNAWASFDDPMTVLLTVYISAIALGTSPSGMWQGDGPLYLLADLGTNLALAAAAWLLWLLVRRWPPVAALLLIPLLAGAVLGGFMLGVAVLGLFWRPALPGLLHERLVARAVTVAFLSATFLLGLLLAAGIRPWDLVLGVVLGLLAYLAQMLVGTLVTLRLPLSDRFYLALGQQNGITAIILALVLQPHFPRTVAIVAPAILVVNTLHLLANRRLTRLTDVEPHPDHPSERLRLSSGDGDPTVPTNMLQVWQTFLTR